MQSNKINTNSNLAVSGSSSSSSLTGDFGIFSIKASEKNREKKFSNSIAHQRDRGRTTSITFSPT